MATDNSPPKIRVILTIAFSSVVILAALQFVFSSYFQMMTEEAEHSHQRPQEELLKLREGEQKNLTSGPMPISAAMKALASGRDGTAAALKDIEPQPSTDLGPLVGWLKAPNQALIDRLTAEAEAASADAGAAPMVGTIPDGGAPSDAASDKRGDAARAPLTPSTDAAAAPTAPKH
jgi:hypothetical protein